jgi:precorrin-6A synthase
VTGTRRIRIIGIGSGHPDQVTAEAAAAIASVDFVLAADKRDAIGGEDRLLVARREIAALHGDPDVVPVRDPERDRNDPADYTAAVGDWHDARAAAYEQVLLEREGDAAFLVWGDPMLYDSTIRVVERIRDRGNVEFEWDVLPGISSLQVLCARHRIVLHEVGQPTVVTTGRRLDEAVGQGGENIAVMLDGRLACASLEDRDRWRIWWGANLGTDDEALVAGPMDGVLAEIRAARSAAKQHSGWVMDTYLLRRR